MLQDIFYPAYHSTPEQVHDPSGLVCYRYWCISCGTCLSRLVATKNLQNFVMYTWATSKISFEVLIVISLPFDFQKRKTRCLEKCSTMSLDRFGLFQNLWKQTRRKLHCVECPFPSQESKSLKFRCPALTRTSRFCASGCNVPTFTKLDFFKQAWYASTSSQDSQHGQSSCLGKDLLCEQQRLVSCTGHLPFRFQHATYQRYLSESNHSKTAL